MAKGSVPACWCVHDDVAHLALSIGSFAQAGPGTVFVSKLAWNGTEGDWESSVRIVEAAGAEAIVGEWPDESLHRRAALAEMHRRGCHHLLIPDSDEVVEPRLLDRLLRLAEADAADLVRVRMETFWKGPNYVIRPREALAPILMLDARTAEHIHIREYSGDPLTLTENHGLLLHLSYAGSDARILRKISTWGHRQEVGRDWYERVWLGWDRDRSMRNLHPTHPECYGVAERIEVPELLQMAIDERVNYGEPPRPHNWPKVSVVIPLYGGEADIMACLYSLLKFRDLIHEIIVVDDKSPDQAAEAAEATAKHGASDGTARPRARGERKARPLIKVIRNAENLGFGATANRGIAAASGDAIVILNSDTVVPRSGFVRLIETLWSSGTVAAAGPFSNNVGYHQHVSPTYSSLENLDLFAQDFAHRPVQDLEVNMLVGFCLAVRRSALQEVGPFDERFGVGMFEDNDLCYRLLRAGYRLKVAARAYVHHEGSRSLLRRQEHPTQLLGRNRQVYYDKWRQDLETGFASHLAGVRAEPIVFDPERHPDRVAALIAEKRDAARISLCIIAKNEERCLRECLMSAKPFFYQMIVVDTGSTDRTVEIAKECGAEAYSFPWTDSFSEARNESFKYAKGNWIFWMDADDTLPFACGVHLLDLARANDPSATGYVVPVRFVEPGPGATEVDHVKLVRNGIDAHFVFRLHEQILPSLRAAGGQIVRSQAFVLHSGQDTSPEGQARKREMHYRLLALDLEEQGENTFILFNLGMTDYFNGFYESATGWLERSILAGDPKDSHMRKVYALLCGSLRRLDRLDDALDVARKGLEAVGEDPELRFQAGGVLADLGRFEEAKVEYLAMTQDISGQFSSLHTGILGHIRDHNMGLVHLGLLDYVGARGWFVRALEVRPLYAPSLEELWKAAQDYKDFTTLRLLIDIVAEASGHSRLWADLGCDYHRALEGEQGAESFLTRGIAMDPHAHELRSVLAQYLIDRERFREAVPHLQFLASQGVAEGAYKMGVVLMRHGQFEEAEPYLSLAQQLDPTHELVVEQLANLRKLLLNTA